MTTDPLDPRKPPLGAARQVDDSVVPLPDQANAERRKPNNDALH